MKTKIVPLIIVAIVGISGTTFIVLRKEAKQGERPRTTEGELSQAMSNYVNTFKLDTSPPIFPESNLGRTNRASTQKNRP